VGNNIVIYRGVNDRRYSELMRLSVGEGITINRFISTSIVQDIANQHQSGNIITILLATGTHAFYLNAVNDLPGGGQHGNSRQVDLVIEVFDDYEMGRLDPNNVNYANGEEEILLGPGTLICVVHGVFKYQQAE
jgi:hypothetical protein